MITRSERHLLELRASRLPTIEAMAALLHRETGYPMWFCKGWAWWIKNSDNGVPDKS
jgi:hypothetical protein